MMSVCARLRHDSAKKKRDADNLAINDQGKRIQYACSMHQGECACVAQQLALHLSAHMRGSGE